MFDRILVIQTPKLGPCRSGPLGRQAPARYAIYRLETSVPE
jgi:hypothetical protein